MIKMQGNAWLKLERLLREAFRDPAGWSAQKTANAGISAEDLSLQGGWAADAVREFEDEVGHLNVRQTSFAVAKPGVAIAFHPANMNRMAVFYGDSWFYKAGPDDKLPSNVYQSVNGARLPAGMATGMIKLAMDRQNQKALSAPQEARIHEVGIGSYPQNLAPRPGGNYGRGGSQSGAWSSGRLVLRQPEDHVPVDEEDDGRLDTEYGLGFGSITQVPGAQTH